MIKVHCFEKAEIMEEKNKKKKKEKKKTDENLSFMEWNTCACYLTLNNIFDDLSQKVFQLIGKLKT